MNKQYILLGIVSLLVVWWLFAPKAPEPSQRVVVPLVAEENDTETAVIEEDESVTPADQDEENDVSPGTIVLTGTFVGLVESEPDGDNRVFLYLLLNDETEVMRISLKPLLGFTDFNPEERLGVSRGELVRVTGEMSESSGEFVIRTIESL